MGITVIITLWAVYLIFQDRKDWFKYVVVGMAFMFLAGTSVGRSITSSAVEGAAWVDKTVSGWMS